MSAKELGMDTQDVQDKASKKSWPSYPSMLTTLTPDEKGRLAKNFKGYDISPDMVRLSLVNLDLNHKDNYRMSRPYRAKRSLQPIPRVLPWAGMSRPFRPNIHQPPVDLKYSALSQSEFYFYRSFV